MGATSAGLNGGQRLAKPFVLCIAHDAEQWHNYQVHLSGRFDLLWAPNDSRACALLKDWSANLAAIILHVELPGSRLDGTQLARIVRGTLDPDRLSALPEYARTVPLCPRVPIVFVTNNISQHAAALADVRASKIFPCPVDHEALVRSLEGVTMLMTSSPSSRLLQATARVELSTEDLIRLIDSEHGLRARLERLGQMNAACAAEGPCMPLRLERLGVGEVRALAMGTAAVDMLPESAALRSLYGNALRRAVAAALIAEHLRLPCSLCFSLGMLLESGLFMRARHNPTGACEVAEAPALARATREGAAGDVPHNVTSAHIARGWGVEERLVAAIEQHHHEMAPPEPMARVAWLAEQMAAVYETGDRDYCERVVATSARRIGLKASAAEEILKEIPGRMRSAAIAVGRDLPPEDDAPGQASDLSQAVAEIDRSYRGLVRLLSTVAREKDALAARLRAANARLAEYAATDALTRLANRQAFEETLRRKLEVADRVSLPLSLILADLDGFRLVNDEHGEQMGDEVLCSIADLVRRSIRSGDYCARFGGEEFAVILLGSGLDLAVGVAERIRERISSTRGVARIGSGHPSDRELWRRDCPAAYRRRRCLARHRASCSRDGCGQVCRE